MISFRSQMAGASAAAVCLAIGVALLGAACSAGAPQQPPKPPPPPLEYIGEWGVRGDGPGQLKSPTSVAVDTVGKVYVTDAGSGYIHKFEPWGTPLLSFQDAALAAPDSIAIDRGGAIYVADPVRGNVGIFDPDGERFRVLHCAPGRKSKEPLGVAADDDGNVFIVDARLNRIQKLNLRGRLLKSWGKAVEGPGELKSPAAVAVGPDGFLYVSDTGNRRVIKFTRDGEFVAELAAPAGGASAVLAGLAASEKYIIAADPDAHGVHVWLLDGKYKFFDKLEDRLKQSEPSPHSVAVSPRGELLVLDPVTPRVLRFRINF